MNLDEIESALDWSREDSREHWLKIIRDTGMYTVALFSVSDSPKGDLLNLAGTGTLILIGESHYILTAAHVWYKCLQPANMLGITLREVVDHKCFIATNLIAAFGPSKPSNWGEWGPDLVLLRIPPARIGEIKAFKVFYAFPVGGSPTIQRECIQTHLLMGTPHGLGKFKQDHASVQIIGTEVAVPGPQLHNSFDYFDLKTGVPQPAKNFGGVSGGGLWRILIYPDPETGKIDSVAELKGVAFFEIDVVEGRGTVRCHGPESIRRAISAVN